MRDRCIYTNGSYINERITAAAVAPNYLSTLTLGSGGDAQAYHAELTGIANALQTEADSTISHLTDRSIVVYSDSQAALKAIKKADPMTSQDLFRQIYSAADSLVKGGASLRLQWIPGHKDVPGNEQADKAAKETATLIGPIEKPQIRFLSAVSSRINLLLEQLWKSR